METLNAEQIHWGCGIPKPLTPKLIHQVCGNHLSSPQNWSKYVKTLYPKVILDGCENNLERPKIGVQTWCCRRAAKGCRWHCPPRSVRWKAITSLHVLHIVMIKIALLSMVRCERLLLLTHIKCVAVRYELYSWRTLTVWTILRTDVDYMNDIAVHWEWILFLSGTRAWCAQWWRWRSGGGRGTKSPFGSTSCSPSIHSRPSGSKWTELLPKRGPNVL
jgi:hypothetical protein